MRNTANGAIMVCGLVLGTVVLAAYSCSPLEKTARATTEREAVSLVRYTNIPGGLSKYDDGGVVCYMLDAPKGAAMQCFKK
jgi:hypothetical protein